MRLAGNVEHVNEMRNTYRILIKKYEGEKKIERI
jgi:hypothetical protein